MALQRDPVLGLFVDTAHDAARVGRPTDASADVLLAKDPRVQKAFAALRDRMIAREEAADFSDAAVARAVFEDVMGLASLVKTLGLAKYRWMPMALYRAFGRSIEIAAGTPDASTAWSLTVPEGLPWAAVRRAPKAGDVHNDDLARDAAWWYRVYVQEPRETPYQIAREYELARGISEAKSYVRSRIRGFLDLLDVGD
jgi:hypothetical protein